MYNYKQNLIILFAFIFTILFSVNAFSDQKNALLMATTTSTDNTGLLDYLAPYFERDTGIELKWVATGTGKALKLGQNCDCDILMVHAPKAEKKYVNNFYGIDRRQFMYNDFVLIGPKNDPANIKGKNVISALEKIKQKKAVFVSRGDDSGTNKKEKILWKKARVKNYDRKPWYIETGQGMIATILIAQEKAGYALTDRGTYIKYAANMKNNPELKILVEKDPILKNQYSMIIVNPERCKDVKTDMAIKLSEWVCSKKGQKLIKDYKLLNKQLFIPNYGK